MLCERCFSNFFVLPEYSLLMLVGQELLMARPGRGSPWLPYTSRRLPDTGSYAVLKKCQLNESALYINNYF